MMHAISLLLPTDGFGATTSAVVPKDPFPHSHSRARAYCNARKVPTLAGKCATRGAAGAASQRGRPRQRTARGSCEARCHA